ncbi:MAG: dihydrofolate reductase family protein [Candidatus Methanoperedens sp.]|nr:dihydrofolate reductase family protein [Candidatus Methanoperedens sp.]MCZ7370348.1 dihydrofolate reductase family protein [Candidatus Methanoperedens sp.]
MKKLVVGDFLTLDGIMQAPSYPWEDTERGFKYGGWQMPYFDAEKGKIIGELIAAADALLLGRVTYQIFAAYWPNAPEDDPIGHKLNSIPKYVVSTTLDKVEWNNSMLIKKNVEEEVAKLKQQPGSGFLYVPGSGKLVQSLMKAGIVDEYVLMIHPLVLGSGKRLFENGVGPIKLKLVDSKTTSSGVVILTYQPQST